MSKKSRKEGDIMESLEKVQEQGYDTHEKTCERHDSWRMADYNAYNDHTNC